MISLRGKVALITGGSRGIGLAIAKNFAAKGASTILVARDPVRLRDAIAAVEAVNYTHPPRADDEEQPGQSIRDETVSDDYVPFYTGVAGDVAQATMWEDIRQKLNMGQMSQRPLKDRPKMFEPDLIDVLVNCAGVSQTTLLRYTSPETIDEILDTNLRSAVLACKFMTTYMRPCRGERSIINVSSVMGVMGGRGAVVYAASKAGMLGLTSSLACEMASHKGIRVNTILPGYIETKMTEGNLPKERLTKLIPMRRFGTADEVADAAAFLAQNAYVNNCTLTIDGGLSAGALA